MHQACSGYRGLEVSKTGKGPCSLVTQAAGEMVDKKAYEQTR